MTDDKLQCALTLQRTIRHLEAELEAVDSVFGHASMLSAVSRRQILAIAKRDIEVQISQLRQEYEAL